jgi:hypothetical protein
MESTNLHELTAESPASDQLSNINITLRPHQLTLLYHCKKLESEDVEIDLSRMPNIHTSTSTTNVSCKIRSRVGIIADKVGSGKSNVILSLIASDDNTTTMTSHYTSTYTYGLNTITMTVDQDKRTSNISVLVIPHNLVNQWTTYITGFFKDDVKYLLISKAKHFNSITIENLREYRLIMVTTTFYKDLTNFLLRAQIQLRRAIFDEIDMMNITSCDIMDSAFYWFVTASYNNLLHPRGYARYDRITGRYVTVAEGIRAGGYVKNLFASLYCGQNNMRPITNLIIVKNRDSFVDESIRLPPIQYMYIKCKTPRTIDILHGLVDREVIQCLNSGDVEGAIRHVNSQHKVSESNIINILLEKYQKQLHNCVIMMEYVRNHMQYDSEDQRQTELDRLAEKKREYQSKIESITNRIKVTETCHICFDSITNKTIVNCCANAFCFACVSKWISHRHTCPLCRDAINLDNLYVVRDNVDVQLHEQQAIQEPDENKPHESFDKLKNLKNIINKIDDEYPNNKILVFSMNERIFYNVSDVLASSNRRVKMLKGRNTTIANTVTEYQKGEINTLLVNPDCYGNGINLENTTDVIMLHKFDSEIEKQVIGRAQRYGRTNSLRIWYLLYENEMPSSQ